MTNLNDKPVSKPVEADQRPKPMPPAGPHARENLTDHMKTPGTGALPDDRSPEADIGSE